MIYLKFFILSLLIVIGYVAPALAQSCKNRTSGCQEGPDWVCSPQANVGDQFEEYRKRSIGVAKQIKMLSDSNRTIYPLDILTAQAELNAKISLARQFSSIAKFTTRDQKDSLSVYISKGGWDMVRDSKSCANGMTKFVVVVVIKEMFYMF